MTAISQPSRPATAAVCGAVIAVVNAGCSSPNHATLAEFPIEILLWEFPLNSHSAMLLTHD